MRLRKLILFLSVIFTVFAIILLLIANVRKIRWDKVPVIKFFVLEINLYPSGFDASYLKEPIKWYQLDKEPDNFENEGIGPWFAINPYTKSLLKEYMRKNNIGIVPDSWDDLKLTSNLEECLDIFDFVELGEPLKIDNTAENICNVAGFISLGAAMICWILFIVKFIYK